MVKVISERQNGEYGTAPIISDSEEDAYEYTDHAQSQTWRNGEDKLDDRKAVDNYDGFASASIQQQLDKQLLDELKVHLKNTRRMLRSQKLEWEDGKHPKKKEKILSDSNSNDIAQKTQEAVDRVDAKDQVQDVTGTRASSETHPRKKRRVRGKHRSKLHH